MFFFCGVCGVFGVPGAFGAFDVLQGMFVVGSGTMSGGVFWWRIWRKFCSCVLYVFVSHVFVTP